jgi:hypothetical protein
MTRRKKHRGFNLIEAAIVLGVVGIVIGGIWVAAATVMEEWKVNRTVADIQLIVKNMQSLISIADAEAIGNSVSLNTTAMSAGVFPANWVPANWVSGGPLKNPFGGNATVWNWLSPPRFDLDLYSIPASACAKLVVKVSTMGALAGSTGSGSSDRPSLGKLEIVNSTWWSTTTFPVSLATATAKCSETSWVYLSFGYTRPN